jgi:predicted O-methyltransferase YrrM
MSSIRKLRLLEIAVDCLAPGEAYLEVGTYRGKTLIAALRRNRAPAVACDNFSEFVTDSAFEILQRNLRKYGVSNRVTFFNADFRVVLDGGKVRSPVGVYLYDGAHDEVSQFDGINFAEALLADVALVIVDDWRFCADSQSYARLGTERAIAASPHRWTQLYELPARYNGDHALWWNGIAVYSFERRNE